MEKNIKISGVSLIEVMISMVLIALLLIAVASVFPRMSSQKKGIQESDIAKTIATEVLEGLQMYAGIDPDKSVCGDPTKYPDGFDVFYEEWWDKPKTIGAATYTTIWTVCDATSNPNFKTTDVTVSWTKQGKPHNVKVTGAIK